MLPTTNEPLSKIDELKASTNDARCDEGREVKEVAPTTPKRSEKKRWHTLSHNGPIFPEPYVCTSRCAHGVRWASPPPSSCC